jgi:hypothetical protein
MKSRGLAILFCITAVTLAACSMAQITPTKDPQIQEHLGTAVAGTLTASVGTITRTLPPATPEPSDTPTIAPTHEPGPLKVVYSRAGSIWIWEEGGSKKQLTNNIVDFRPRLSDDGSLVVFERNNELYMINSDGSNLHALVNDAFLKDYIPTGLKFIWAEYFDWMPNTHYVYFTTKAGISGPETDIFLYDLFRADADTGEVKQIVAPGSGGVPYFSADGKTIAMAQSEAIYLASIDGTGARKVLSFDYIYTGSDWYAIPVAVSLPDGNGFRMVLPMHGTTEHSYKSTEFWNIPLEGDATLIYSFAESGNYSRYAVGYRNLSPNGENFVYANYESDKNTQLCIHRNGSSSDDCWFQQGSNGSFVKWTPDNTHFVTFDYDENRTENFYMNDGYGNTTKINTSHLMSWISMNRYLFVDREYNLYLGTSQENPIKIDKGIIQKVDKVDIWAWQFDFSY